MVLPPTRLLKLHPKKVQVVEMTHPVAIQYACLTHRWAPNQSYGNGINSGFRRCCRLKSNVSRKENFIKITNLLPTYQDAVSITKALGLNYLWIDALCIVQDDADDVRIQIAQMGTIYQNCYFAIAGDVHRDHTYSFLNSRRQWSHTHKETIKNPYGEDHTIYFRRRREHKHLSWSGIFARGWCFQERLLASRVIRFQNEEVVFECNESVLCECGLPSNGLAADLGKSDQDLHMTWRPHDKPASARLMFSGAGIDSYQPWQTLVQLYSLTQLTYEKDRANALAGIAAKVQAKLVDGSRYLAGLWSSSLFEDLLWYTVMGPGGRRRDTSEPSWSWMSIDLGPTNIAYPSLPVQRTFLRLREISYTPRSAQLPLGNATIGAFLEMEGPLTSMEVLNQWRHRYQVQSDSWEVMDEPYTKAQRGNDPQYLRVAQLGRGRSAEKDVFLILRQAVEDMTTPECYVRVGYLEVRRRKDIEVVDVSYKCTHLRLY